MTWNLSKHGNGSHLSDFSKMNLLSLIILCLRGSDVSMSCTCAQAAQATNMLIAEHIPITSSSEQGTKFASFWFLLILEDQRISNVCCLRMQWWNKSSPSASISKIGRMSENWPRCIHLYLWMSLAKQSAGRTRNTCSRPASSQNVAAKTLPESTLFHRTSKQKTDHDKTMSGRFHH